MFSSFACDRTHTHTHKHSVNVNGNFKPESIQNSHTMFSSQSWGQTLCSVDFFFATLSFPRAQHARLHI